MIQVKQFSDLQDHAIFFTIPTTTIAFLFPNKRTYEYHQTTKDNSSEQEIHAKQELKALKISKQEYSTNISESQEYSNEKAERVSLP